VRPAGAGRTVHQEAGSRRLVSKLGSVGPYVPALDFVTAVKLLFPPNDAVTS
jgi:hypothetical protein